MLNPINSNSEDLNDLNLKYQALKKSESSNKFMEIKANSSKFFKSNENYKSVSWEINILMQNLIISYIFSSIFSNLLEFWNDIISKQL